MYFYLIRHGDIPFAPGDPGLTTLGQSQAAAAGDYLKGRGIACVFTSPLLRARETAAIIAAHLAGLGLAPPVRVDSRLRERMNWGDLRDQTWPEFLAEWNRADADRDYIPLGGISSHQAAANLADFIQQAAGQPWSGPLAVVTHGGIISDYLLDFIPPADLVRLNPAWALQQGDIITHCSVTTLLYDDSGPHLERLAVVVAGGQPI